MAKQYYSLDEVVGSDDNLLTLDQVFGTPQERMQQAKARQQEVMRGLPQTFDAPLSPEQQKRLDNDVRYMAETGLVGIGQAEIIAREAYKSPDPQTSIKREMDRRRYRGFLDELGVSLEAGGESAISGVIGTVGQGLRTLARNEAFWPLMRFGPLEQQGQRIDVTGRDLDQWAQAIYEDTQRWQAQPGEGGGLAGFIANATGRTLPYFAVATVAGAAAGPAATWAVTAAIEGDGAYRDAIAAGATEEQAQLNRIIVGSVNGVIELAQVGKVLGVAEGASGAALKEFKDAVAERAWKKIAKAGGKLTTAQVIDAVGEGAEEVAQEWVGAGAARIIHGEEMTDMARRTGTAFAGGFVGGGLLQGGSLVIETALTQRTGEVETGEKESEGPREIGTVGQGYTPRIQPGMTADEMIEQFASDVVNLDDIEAIVARSAADQQARAALEKLFGKKVEVSDEAQAAPQEVPGVPGEGQAAGVEGAPTVAESAPVAPEAQAGEGRRPWEMTPDEYVASRELEYADEDLSEEELATQRKAWRKQWKSEITNAVREGQTPLEAVLDSLPEQERWQLLRENQRLLEGYVPPELRDYTLTYRQWLKRLNEDAVVTGNSARALHRSMLQRAITEGKPVPRRVLEEYQSEPWAQEALAKLEAETPPVRPSEPRETEPAPTVGREGGPQAGGQAEAGAKQPFEMTREEFRQWAAENHPHPQIRKSAKSKRSMEPGTTQAVDLATVRDNEVLQAFNRGEAIPPEVLKDYPDLQKRAKDERELRDQTAKEDAWKEILVGKLREQHVADLTDAEIERAFAGTGARNKNTEMAKKFVREGKITLADVLRPIFVVDSDGKIGRVVRWTDEGYPVVVYPGKTGGVQPGTAPTGVAGQPYEYELGPDVRPATEVDFNKQIRPGGSETQIDLRRWKDQFLQEQQQRSKPGVTTLPTEPAAKKAKWVEIADELTASIQENGLSDRGGDYWSARLKELSDADLKRFYDWTQLQGAKNPYIQRFAGGNASAEMRRRHGLESEPAPAEKPEAPPTAEKTPAQILAEHGLKVEKRISKAGNPWWAVTGNTGEPGIKAVLDRLVPKDRGGKPQKPAKIYDESVGRKVWTRSFYDGDPTEKIARELQGLPAATEPRGTGETGTQEPVDTEARASDLESERKRSAENERPIRDRIDRDIEGYVSPETSRLISLGLKHNIPQDIVNEQIEDVALGVRAFEEQGRLFLLANEAGTGKTYVLGGLIRELKARGVKKILYVTLNEDLVNQIQGDLADYGLEGVEFVTYAGIRKGGHRINGGVVIFDEAHSTKNVTSQQGKSAQDLMKQARFTILSSATPFENPVEAAYLDATGVFDRVGGHHEWAKMYGADVITTKYFDYAAGQEVTKERLVWNGGKHKVKDQIEARNWFKRQGAFTQRAKRLPKGSVTTTFRKQAASDQYVEMVETVLAAYAQADVEANSSREFNNPSNHAMIKMHEVNTLKRILEAAKVQAGIERARELIAEGKQVVIFTETKADRSIGKFRKTGDAKGKEYTYPEMQRIWEDYQDDLRAWWAEGRGRGKRPKAPFSEAIMLIAEAMHDAGIDYTLPGVSDALREAFPDAALYTGEVTDAQAKKNLKAWKDGKVKVLIATMAKGGTGLSLHDTTGTKPDRVQVGINLPWTATQIDQTSGRLARYGIHPDHPVGIEWLFADNIDFERTLARKVGGRMQDMGALVRGLEIEAADALQDFDFEDAFDAGRVTVHEAAVQPRKTTKLTDERIAAVGAAEQYRQAEALERSRPKSSGEFDFFETPYPLSVFMTRVSEVKKGDKVLEPSAGQGSLLRFLPDGVDVDALEVNRQHAHKLSQMGPKVVSTQIDFLIWTPYRGEYDVILMNPPFSRKAGVGWQDAAHVMKAYEHLKDGGRLVAVMGEGSFFRSDKQSSAFRDWLDEVGAQVVKMPEEVFKRSGTKVNVRLVVIDKGAEPGRTDMDLPEATTDRYLELEGYIKPRAEQATAEPTPERQEAVEQAQEEAETATEEALSPEAEQQPSRTVERKAIEPTAKGAETQVEVPGGKPIKARYAVLQLRSLKPSHDAHTGTPSPNETYPKGLQPRDYREGSEEFLKIVGFATEKKAGYYVNTHPGADSGPPTVTPDGTVINGNGRVMSLQYAYTVLGDYDWYRNALNDARQQFGLEYASGGAIELGETPVLVRIVEMDPDSVEAKKFARAGNVTTTQAQSPLRTAASLADLVNVDVLDTLQLDEKTTFSDAVKSTKGRQFRQALAESLPDAERARFINEMGDLTDAGTELARNMLMLKIFPVEVLEKLSDERKGLKQSLEGAIPQLLKAKRDYPEIDIAGPLVEAVEFLGRNPDVQDMAGVNDTVNQGALFGGGSFDSLSPEGRILVSFFFAKTNSGGKVMNSPSVFRTRLKNLMVDLSGGTGLFAQTQDIGALIADDLGVPMVKGAKFEAKAKPSPKPAEEATPLQTAIAQRDFDTLKRMLAPGQDANRQRFEEITQIVLPDTEAGTENVIGEFVRGDADRYRRQSGRTSIIPDAAAELAAISRRLVGGPASLVGNAVAMFRRNVVSVNRYLRTMGGAGRLIAHDFDVITHAVTKQANNDKADLRRIFRGMSRNQLERAAMVLNGRLDAKTQPRKIVEAAEAMRKVLDRSMNEANALGMTRNVRGKRIPIGGSGKAFPQIPNQKGMDFLHEAKTKAKGSARVFAWAQEQVKAGRFKDIDEAIIALQKFRDAQLRAVNPYFESTRVELPVDMIEWDPVKVLPHLIDRNWMTIEGVRQWGTEKGGQSFPLLRSRIERIRRDYGSDHAQRIENYVQVAFGDRSIVHKNAEAISRTVRGFQFISKVGISPLTIMRNMADRIPKGMAISPLATIRASIEYPPFVNGFIRASQKLEDRMVRAGAVFGHGSLSEGYEAGSFFSELLASPFAQSERGNQVFIATVAYHKLMHDIAILESRGADVSGRLIDRLAAVFGQSRAQAAYRVGPDIEATILAGQPVSQEQIEAFLADAVSRNAFPMLLNTKPVWYETHPLMRVIAQFKTWPIRQTNLIWNDVLKYTVKTGDPTRLLGFLIGTLIAGEIYNILRDWLFGKDESLLSQMRKDPEGRRIGMAIFNDLIDGGGVGMIADFTYGIYDWASGVTLRTAKNVSDTVRNIRNAPALTPQALERLAEREISPYRQIKAAMSKLDATVDKGNISRQYNQTRAAAWLYKEGKENPTAADKAMAWTDDAIWGRPDYGIGENTLAYELASRQIVAGDIDDAAKYLSYILSRADDRKKALTGIKQSMARRAPLGPIAQRDLAAFLRSLPADERHRAVATQRMYLRHYQEALRRAIRSTR